MAGFAPMVADVIHLLLFEGINAFFRDLLTSPSFGSLAIVIAIYSAYVASLWFVNRLEPDVRPRFITIDGKLRTTWPKFLCFYPSIGFGAVMIGMILVSGGVLDDASPLSDGSQTALLAACTVAWIIHSTIAISDDEPVYRRNTVPYMIVLVGTLIVSELTLNLGFAAWTVWLGSPDVDPGRAGKGVELALFAPLFLAFFAAPRFTFMAKHFTWLGVASGVLFTTYEVWTTLDVVAL